MDSVWDDPNNLKYGSDQLKDSEEIVSLTVKQREGALQYASDRLRDSKEFVSLAVKQNGWALHYVSDRPKDAWQVAKRLPA